MGAFPSDMPCTPFHAKDKMYKQLVQYKDANDGSIEIPKMAEREGDDPGARRLKALRRWSNTQARHRHRRRWTQGHAGAGSLTYERVKRLREAGLRAPSYDEMYGRLAARNAETRTLDVDANEELHAWAKEQRRLLARHLRGWPAVLSDVQVRDLGSLGIRRAGAAGGPPGAADAATAWNSMLEALRRYGEENGTFVFPSNVGSLPKAERPIKYWVAAQRREYKKLQRGEESSLTARQLQRLNAVGLDLTPRPDKIPWEQRMRSLREFVSEHGHCKPKKQHPLASFVSNIRHFNREREDGKATCLTDERVVRPN